ncbi:MAG: hypothetical protein WA921_12595 [Ahrensia sp.]
MLVAALVLAAFAHSPATTTAIEKAQFAAAYTLPDGSLPVLCDPNGNDENAGFDRCAFCIIATGAALNGSDNSASCIIAFFAETVRFSKTFAAAPVASRLLTTSAPRAPPCRIA